MPFSEVSAGDTFGRAQTREGDDREPGERGRQIPQKGGAGLGRDLLLLATNRTVERCLTRKLLFLALGLTGGLPRLTALTFGGFFVIAVTLHIAGESFALT